MSKKDFMTESEFVEAHQEKDPQASPELSKAHFDIVSAADRLLHLGGKDALRTSLRALAVAQIVTSTDAFERAAFQIFRLQSPNENAAALAFVLLEELKFLNAYSPELCAQLIAGVQLGLNDQAKERAEKARAN